MAFGLDDIGDFFEDVVDIPGNLVEAAASLFDGPGGVAGIFVSGAMLFVGGPTALVPALVAGVAVTEGANAIIKTRHLNSEERTVAEMVYGNSLPHFDKIILTNLTGMDNRAFTIPNAAGECLINIGADFNDPIRSRHYLEYGQVFIHELGHAWQIHHHSFTPGLICEGMLNQSRYSLGANVYDPGGGGEPWSSYNLEQQATIIDLWYGGFMRGEGNVVFPFEVNHTPVGGCSPIHPFYPYIIEINGGTPPPAVQSLSVRQLARRKFGAEGSFSVPARFPRYKEGLRSLRKSIIGLRG